MADQSLISHFDRRAMRGIAEELLEPFTFLVSTFFTAMEAFASRKLDLDLVKGKRRVGAYVRRASQGQFVDAVGYKTRTVEPPYLKPKIPITPDDIQKRTPGEGLFDNSGNLATAVSDFVARQVNELDSIVSRNEELQAMQALFLGKIEARNEDGDLLEEIDFKRDASLFVTAPIPWTTVATAVPFEDMRKLRRLVQKASGFIPRMAVMASDSADAFLALDVRKQLSKDQSNRGEISFEMEDNGGIFLGRADGFEFWSYDEFVVDPADGVEKPLIPSGKVLIASMNARATRTYGGVEVASLEGDLQILADPRFLDMSGEKDPAAAIVQLLSAPLMVTNHVDAYGVLTVL